MKKTYTAPAMQKVLFQSEEILLISSIFASLSADKDNEGSWKDSWDA